MMNKKSVFRRILPLFMAMVLCITMQETTAFAAEPALRFPAKQEGVCSQERAGLSLEEYVVAALENHEPVIDVSAYNISSPEGIEEYLRILNDNPQLFYVRKQIGLSSMGDQVIYYQPSYLVEKEEAAQMREELEKAVQRALEQVEESMDEVQKALVVHDYLAQNCEYDQERLMAGNMPDISHTAYGSLVNRIAACDGYADAYAYIMEDKLGISCTVVSSDQMNHAWNMIEIDGKWYHVDVTWDDPVWDRIGRVNHNYFLLSDQAVSGDHYAWTQGYTADSDRYDQEFWIGVESAISHYNGAWYYSGYDSGNRKVVLKKKESLFATDAETVYQTSLWQTLAQSYMYLSQANRKLYFNTSTEIMQMDADGDIQVFYEPDDLAGKQIFGFTVQAGEFLYAPNDGYPSDKQSDIRKYSSGETEPSATPGQKPTEPSATPGQRPTEPPATPGQEPTEPSAIPGETPAGPPAVQGQMPVQREIPEKNSIIRDDSGNTYQVTRSGEVNGTVAYVKAEKNQAATVNVPSKVTIDNITYEVTSVSANAFCGNTKLKKVTIGKNVTSIGNSAFEGCTALKSIVIPAKVRSIGKNAFKNCKSLKSIRIKGNVLQTVGQNAFRGIHAKAKIKVPQKQLKAYEKRLKGKGQKKTVRITR